MNPRTEPPTPQISSSDMPKGSKQKLIVAAIELIRSKGFEGAGINEILELAQVTKSNFYYHFKSKEQLCLEALDVIAEHFHQEIVSQTYLNKALTPKQRLESIFDCFVQGMEAECCNKGCPFVNLAAETSDFYPEFRQKIMGLFQRHSDLIEKTYQEGVLLGEFKEGIDSKMISNLILSVINGSILIAKTFKSANIIRDNKATLMELICKNHR